MKRKFVLLNILIAMIALSPLVYLAIIFDSLPDMVPVHYDMHFKPDQIDHKHLLWVSNGILSLVSVIIYFLLINLHKIDPKRHRHQPSPVFRRIAIITVVFITALNFLILLSLNNTIKLSQKLLFIFLGLLFAFIGNYMNNIKPNYFAGIRVPWTLSSDYNWKKTHQLAAKVWFAGGFLLIIVSLLIPADYSMPIFLSILGILVIVPIIYSFLLFRRKKNQY